MGIDLQVVLAAKVTAEEAFALPARLNQAQAVVAACRDYHGLRNPSLEPRGWAWSDSGPAITGPSAIAEAWALSPYPRNVMLSGGAGLLCLERNRICFLAGQKLAGFAADYEGCQQPIRRVCRALARELGTDRVLYLPDSGGWLSEVGDLDDTRFEDALARLTACGPPVSAIGALRYGAAVRSGYHYANGALRRPDGTPVPAAEISPGDGRILSGGIETYYDGTPVPPEELARPDLRGGFAYYLDDFRDLT
jgi:hypothetical protein